jgi:hypothetical protein
MRIWSIGATVYTYLKCIVYDKLLNPRQSFWITLYIAVSCRALPYSFHIISQTAQFSSKNYVTSNVRFHFLYNAHLKHFSVWEEFSEISSQIYLGLHVQYTFFTDFNKKLNFWAEFRKNPQISNFTKIRPVGSELYNADRRASMTKLSHFSKFCRPAYKQP